MTRNVAARWLTGLVGIFAAVLVHFLCKRATIENRDFVARIYG